MILLNFLRCSSLSSSNLDCRLRFFNFSLYLKVIFMIEISLAILAHSFQQFKSILLCDHVQSLLYLVELQVVDLPLDGSCLLGVPHLEQMGVLAQLESIDQVSI